MGIGHRLGDDNAITSWLQSHEAGTILLRSPEREGFGDVVKPGKLQSA